jgi:hypothetical protein
MDALAVLLVLRPVPVFQVYSSLAQVPFTIIQNQAVQRAVSVAVIASDIVKLQLLWISSKLILKKLK